MTSFMSVSSAFRCDDDPLVQMNRIELLLQMMSIQGLLHLCVRCGKLPIIQWHDVSPSERELYLTCACLHHTITLNNVAPAKTRNTEITALLMALVWNVSHGNRVNDIEITPLIHTTIERWKAGI